MFPALPHHEVEASDFYKYIESGLLEPRRMRQLLIWCGTRALSEKPSFATEDGPTRLAGKCGLAHGMACNLTSVAREIQQQLLKDFSSKSELSDWLSRVSLGIIVYLCVRLLIAFRRNQRNNRNR